MISAASTRKRGCRDRRDKRGKTKGEKMFVKQFVGLVLIVFCVDCGKAIGQRAVEIRLHSSLHPGFTAEELLQVNRDGFNEVARRVADTAKKADPKSSHVSFNFDVISDKDAPPDKPLGLQSLGRMLQDEEIHLVWMWGLEFGFLQQMYPNLELEAMVCARGNPSQSVLKSQIIVRKDGDIKSVGDLKGGILAANRRQPLMDRLFLESVIPDRDTPGEFFGSIAAFPTARHAILAVCKGKADCVVVNLSDFDRNVALNGYVEDKTRALDGVTKEFPSAALVGRQNVVNGIQPGLWHRTQLEMERLNTHKEGKDALRFWNLTDLVIPRAEFKNTLEKRMAEFDVEQLQRLNEELWKTDS